MKTKATNTRPAVISLLGLSAQKWIGCLYKSPLQMSNREGGQARSGSTILSVLLSLRKTHGDGTREHWAGPKPGWAIGFSPKTVLWQTRRNTAYPKPMIVWSDTNLWIQTLEAAGSLWGFAALTKRSSEAALSQQTEWEIFALSLPQRSIFVH